MIGGIVRAERASVLADVLQSLLLAAAGRGVFLDADCQRVDFAGQQLAGHIEAPAHESALDAAELLAIQKDIGLPVNAVEVEPRDFSGRDRRGGELGAIPEVGVEVRIRNVELVVAEVRIGNRSDIEVGSEHGAGNGGDDPVVGFVARF